MDLVDITLILLLVAAIETIALILIFFFAGKWTIFGLKAWLNKRGSIVFRVLKDSTIHPSVETITDEIKMPKSMVGKEKIETRNVAVAGIFHRFPSVHNRPVHFALEGIQKTVNLFEKFTPTMDVDNINQAQLLTAQTYLNIGRRQGQGKDLMTVIMILVVVAIAVAGLGIYQSYTTGQTVAQMGGALGSQIQQLAAQVSALQDVTLVR